MTVRRAVNDHIDDGASHTVGGSSQLKSGIFPTARVGRDVKLTPIATVPMRVLDDGGG